MRKTCYVILDTLSESLNRYLKSDFGCVQRKCDNVSYTGCCPSTRHLHPEWRGGVQGFKSHHVYKYWSQGMQKHTETHRSNQPGFICRIIHLLTDSTGNDRVFYELTINVSPDGIKRTYSVCINFKGSFWSSVVCCRAGFDWPDYNPYRAPLHRKERCIFCSVFIYRLQAFFFFFMTSTERRYCVLLDTWV